MYETIYVPVDNSDHSDRAVSLSVDLGRAFGSRMVGCHVYAARMHDYRFKQMEFTLPEEYLEETELERQRKIHDSLITMGLKLISESYLGPMESRCRDAGLEFEPRMMDGKHSTEIVRDVDGAGYDLVVMGALGLGRSRHSQLGSVCERVARRCRSDLWIVKHVPDGKPDDRSDTALVGVDGSPQSFGALVTAIELARRFGWRVEAIAVYDPYLHYSVFKGIVNVLSERAAKVFRFEEQNQLHEEIIDTGLAQIYQSHLDVAEKVAEERGVTITKTLLDGKAFEKILDHVEKTRPRLLVLGRIGIHGSPEEPGLGSNTENLVRQSPCDVLLTTGLEYPALDVRAEETIRWTPDAEKRFERVPPMVRGIARTAVYRLAVEKGHSVVTNTVLDEAMDRFMPKSARANEKLAEALVLERAAERSVSICSRCGVTAVEEAPEKCAVCGARSFQVITPEMVRQIIAAEGGAAEEAAYDGRTLKWTKDARRALSTIQDAYRRRRAKARIEKSARLKRLPAVTLEFARPVLEEETGAPITLPATDEAPAPAPAAPVVGDGKKLVARDEKQNPLLSTFDWTPEAAARVLRVPPGFMRNRTQERIEALAREREVATVDLELVEKGIEIGRALMAQMIDTYQANPERARAAASGAGEERGAPPLNEAARLASRDGA
jgi:nucleotide-binding universal stress UspA family protein